MLFNNSELSNFLKTNYIQPVQVVKPYLSHVQKAEPAYEKWITDNSYQWDDAKKAYVGGNNKHFKEYIIALPHNVFVWGIGNVIKVLKNPDKLRLWVTGRGDDFVQKFLELSGYEKPVNLDDPSKGGDIEMGEPVNRVKDFDNMSDADLDNPKLGGNIELGKPVNRVFVPNQTDMKGVALNKYKAIAKKKGGLPSDVIIDLGLKAKESGDQKMLDFLKTVKPLKEAMSPLAELVQAIVQTVVKEMEEPVEEMTGTAAASPVSTPMAFSKRNVEQEEEQIDEMTTTGDVSGYNIPAAFAKKGGSSKGVEGSEKLGFTLTPIGKKEMSRTADKLLSENTTLPNTIIPPEQNKEPVRKQRCAKCQQLKPTDAHGYIAGWECYDCRKPGPMEGEEADAVNDMWAGSDDDLSGYESPKPRKPKTKPDYGTQLRLAWQKAKREKNAEAMTYYETLGDTSASVPFEKFKGSWAYEQWKKKPEIQAHIAKIQSEMKKWWWK